MALCTQLVESQFLFRSIEGDSKLQHLSWGSEILIVSEGSTYATMRSTARNGSVFETTPWQHCRMYPYDVTALQISFALLVSGNLTCKLILLNREWSILPAYTAWTSRMELKNLNQGYFVGYWLKGSRCKTLQLVGLPLIVVYADVPWSRYWSVLQHFSYFRIWFACLMRRSYSVPSEKPELRPQFSWNLITRCDCAHSTGARLKFIQGFEGLNSTVVAKRRLLAGYFRI